MADEKVEEHYHNEGGSRNPMMGILIAILAIVLVVILFFVFGNQFFNGGTNAPSVDVPEQIDVNVNDGGNP